MTPAAPVIYSIKFLIFSLLGTNFLAPKNGHHREYRLVLGHDYRYKLPSTP